MAEASQLGRRLLRGSLGVVALALLGIGAGNAWVFGATAGDIAPSVAEAPNRPVAIVLGNRVFQDGTVGREMALRLRVALELYRAKKAERLYLSGAYRPSESYDEPTVMAAWLERRGVPREAMILDGNGHRTAATMADAAAQGFHDVLVCTQRYHLPRALYLAHHAGLNATGVAAAPPNGSRSDRIHSFLRETLARAETVVEVALRGVRPSGP